MRTEKATKCVCVWCSESEWKGVCVCVTAEVVVGGIQWLQILLLGELSPFYSIPLPLSSEKHVGIIYTLESCPLSGRSIDIDEIIPSKANICKVYQDQRKTKHDMLLEMLYSHPKSAFSNRC